ncbi:MAG: CPBP family intramembrane glutamic endopeptidase [Solirubrobacterales bacterium]
MATELHADGSLPAPPPERSFPPSNWGPGVALLGVLLAIGAGIMLSIPFVAIGSEDGEATTLGNVGGQIALGFGFLLTPMAIAAWRGAQGLPQILFRLGVQPFRLGFALKWMGAAVGAYLAFGALYSLLIVQPEQEDIAEGFGAVPVQVALIVFLAAIAEEVCFRGMLFGGLRERLPRWTAALLAGAVFGLLHVVTGPTAVPPLMVFGAILCLLYEKTGSIVPGIVLHMLNNSVALLSQ